MSSNSQEEKHQYLIYNTGESYPELFVQHSKNHKITVTKQYDEENAENLMSPSDRTQSIIYFYEVSECEEGRLENKVKNLKERFKKTPIVFILFLPSDRPTQAYEAILRKYDISCKPYLILSQHLKDNQIEDIIVFIEQSSRKEIKNPCLKWKCLTIWTAIIFILLLYHINLLKNSPSLEIDEASKNTNNEGNTLISTHDEIGANGTKTDLLNISKNASESVPLSSVDETSHNETNRTATLFPIYSLNDENVPEKTNTNFSNTSTVDETSENATNRANNDENATEGININMSNNSNNAYYSGEETNTNLSNNSKNVSKRDVHTPVPPSSKVDETIKNETNGTNMLASKNSSNDENAADGTNTNITSDSVAGLTLDLKMDETYKNEINATTSTIEKTSNSNKINGIGKENSEKLVMQHQPNKKKICRNKMNKLPFFFLKNKLCLFNNQN